MVRASTKVNKSPYQTTRESLKLTRETASDLLETIAPEQYNAYKASLQAEGS